ncbi:hypothetical protein EST38_g1511 [Candolleomyces aberdarensis]|uniref:Uncharacterized protein n=1 Tax=Candolleomyces aberdarensis TaxID=2316362 RepID=A0A4Q2DWU6_9AGAR|nr:hypothetical protein EST38_g1511 [Candolleomyces aberdarensis]
MKKQDAHLHEVQTRRSEDIIANPHDGTPRWERIVIDICLLFGVILMLLWPWTFFGIVNANGGIQMSSGLSDIVSRYPQGVGAVVTFIGTANHFAVTFLFGQIVMRFGQELISLKGMTVFDVSALSAFRYMTVVWGIEQWKGLGKQRLAVLGLFLAALGASSLVPLGTASLITPGEFNKTAELRGRELDFTSSDSGCWVWLQQNRVVNSCDWKSFGNTQFMTCIGGKQMMDVLDSGRANVLATIGIANETSSLNQLGGEGTIRFRGSVKGVLLIGPNGVPAFDTFQTSPGPFADDDIRRRMVSYNYTLNHQGFESNISCFYDDTSPIRYRQIMNNSTVIFSSFGNCDPASGLQDVLLDGIDYPTSNGGDAMTYWACKQTPQPGSLEPTYFVYLRGRRDYERSIGNITCRISPMRAQEYSVTYLSLPGYFTTSRALVAQSPQKPTFAGYIEWGLVGLGDVIWQGQSWSANLVAEAVFSLGAKKLNTVYRERNPIYPKMFEAMIQGMLEYEATYSRLVYSLGANPPSTCLRDVAGSVSYSVRGWHIDSKDSFVQAGLLLPMTLINLASLILLLSCLFIGKFQYKHNFDATDNVSLLTARVPGVQNGQVRWDSKVQYHML